MHHIFISLVIVDDEMIGMAVVRTNERGTVLKAYADKVSDDKSFEKICDNVYKDFVHMYDESYVVITEVSETYEYFKKNKITLFEAPWLNMSQLAWPLVFSGVLPGRSLDQVAGYFGIKNNNPDTATGNCEYLTRVYWTMMRNMRLAIIAEEGMRDYGGKIIANVRSIIGI